MMIEESQKDVEQYEDKADPRIKTNGKEIKEADSVATALAPQHVQALRGSEVTYPWSHFKPLAPTHLDQGVTRLKVCGFHENLHNSGFSWCGTTKGGLEICCSILGIKLVDFYEVVRSLGNVF